ncbi:hypothetical protein LZ32DRAFT_666577 [Colletotrichum eremochloae]|nr:hypothetical protein LZ32DRAFT_666577 [Colletotrichum eremochloae]
MAPDAGHDGIQGWGKYLHYSLDAFKIRGRNSAYAGQSARTFMRRAASSASSTRPSMETGWSLSLDTITTRPSRDHPNVNHLSPQRALPLLALSAKLIISTLTPVNPYWNGAFCWQPIVYSWYSWHVAKFLGGPTAGIYYAPHGNNSAQALEV